MAADEFRAAWDSLPRDWRRAFAASDEQVLAWDRREAGDSAYRRPWFARIFHLDRLHEQGTSPQLYWERGDSHAELGNWQKAAGDFDQAASLEDAGPRHAYELALVRIAMNDVAGYRAICARLVEGAAVLVTG